MDYQVTLYTQAQVTLTIRNPEDVEDAAVRAITLASTGVPGSVLTGMTNFGNSVSVEIENGDWRVLEVIDESGAEVA